MSPTTSSSAEPASAVSRAELVAVMQRLEQDGLNRAAAGNASVRTPRGMLITPTGVVPTDLTPASMVEMSLSGEVLDPDWRPSSEWRFHRDIYAARPEVNAVVHVHSPYATAQACTRQDIPPFHYMIVAGGGADIRVRIEHGSIDIGAAVVEAECAGKPGPRHRERAVRRADADVST